MRWEDTHVCPVCTFVSRVCGSDEFGETRKRCIIQRTESRNFNKRKIRQATRSWDTRLSPGRKYLRKILHSLSGSRGVGVPVLYIYELEAAPEETRILRGIKRSTLMIFSALTAGDDAEKKRGGIRRSLNTKSII